MKTHISVFLTFLFIQAATAQWSLNFHTPHQQIVEVFSSPSDKIAWFDTNMDSLFQTFDGGLHWTKRLQSGAVFNPSGIFVVNADTAFKTVNQGLFRTIDGGSHWTMVFSGATQVPPVVWMKDNLNGVMAYNGALRITTDAGATWSTSGVTQPPFQITTTTGKGVLWGKGDTLWAALSDHGVAVSNDFGNTWQLPANTGLSFTGYGHISFSGSQLGIAILQNMPFVYVTTDGAATWNESVNTLGANQDVLAYDNQLWFIPNPADHFYVKYSGDFGGSWQQQLFDGDGFDILEKARTGTTLWAGTEKGKIYKYQLPVPVSTGADLSCAEDIRVFPDPFSDHIRIETIKGERPLNYELDDVSGRKILSGQITGPSVILKTTHLHAGLYLLKLRTLGSARVVRLVKP